jgi:hypothetical protein
MASAGIDLLHRPAQPNRAFLNQVEQLEAVGLVALGSIDDQA